MHDKYGEIHRLPQGLSPGRRADGGTGRRSARHVAGGGLPHRGRRGGEDENPRAARRGAAHQRRLAA